MKDILDFLRLVKVNNNREWFHANKDLYLNAKEKFENIAQGILTEIQKFDASCRHLTLSDCVYRFYRDTRFSKDKSPYKTHFGVYVCPKGKKSLWAGYYFHIEPDEITENSEIMDDSGNKSKEVLATLTMPTHSLLCAGTYMPDNPMLRSIREEIFTNGEEYIKTIKKAKGFYLCNEPALKKLPKEIPSGKYDEYIKLKAQLLEMDIDDKFLMQKDIVKAVAKEFRKTYDFVSFINNAVSYTGNY
ncbi:MAG: DUF2461 domain-containing protein [Bacteroidales bacterium]|nr:DUF2461 domain-containing protein [Bacteroidales bacterium]